MADVFISYKREEREKAELLAQMLLNSGLSVWWDYNLLAGDDFDITIERELLSARCVIVIWSPSSVQSRFVKDEAKIALERNILVPVSFEKTAPPIGFGMTHVLEFTQKNKILKPEYEKLLKSIAAKISRVIPDNEPITTSVKSRPVFNIDPVVTSEEVFNDMDRKRTPRLIIYGILSGLLSISGAVYDRFGQENFLVYTNGLRGILVSTIIFSIILARIEKKLPLVRQLLFVGLSIIVLFIGEFEMALGVNSSLITGFIYMVMGGCIHAALIFILYWYLFNKTGGLRVGLYSSVASGAVSMVVAISAGLLILWIQSKSDHVSEDLLLRYELLMSSMIVFHVFCQPLLIYSILRARTTGLQDLRSLKKVK